MLALIEKREERTPHRKYLYARKDKKMTKDGQII